ncbi:hypothetical protein ACFP4H_11555 [Pseudophaeobacter arcticus]|uniref:hypothetical protein n=1 Tax=Pseudophaeobacter arcticus TaxID=385492 RepID=UPI0006854A20|nr:hypothetical protein [Pseudophaeobacter arcticus]
MLDKLRFKGPQMIASSLFFTFVFYVGSRMSHGENMGGNRGIMRWMAEALNFLSDTFGAMQAGYTIMAIALFGGVFAVAWIWRDPHF